MATNLVHVMNTSSGVSGMIPRHLFEHPVFGRALVEYQEGSKEFVPELVKPADPAEFAEKHTKRIKPKDSAIADEDAPAVEQEPDKE